MWLNDMKKQFKKEQIQMTNEKMLNLYTGQCKLTVNWIMDAWNSTSSKKAQSHSHETYILDGCEGDNIQIKTCNPETSGTKF